MLPPTYCSKPGATQLWKRRLAAFNSLSLLIMLLCVFDRELVLGQSGRDPPEKNLPRFEVSSIRPSARSDVPTVMQFTADGFRAENVTVMLLLQEAFRAGNLEIPALPKWVSDQKYNIDAKVSIDDVPIFEKLSSEERGLVLRSLLVDRFSLKFHQTTREEKAFALVIAKGGPRLKQANPKDTYQKGIPGFDGRPGGAGLIHFGPDFIEGQGISIAMLVRELDRALHRQIVDATELHGTYDIELKWTLDEMANISDNSSNGDSDIQGDSHEVPSASLFTALKEQLGLEIVSRKGPQSVMIIDNIARPSEN
jgi:bla regulator protein blaR1